MEFKLSSFRGIFEIWHQNYFGCINKIFVLNFRIPFWVSFIWKLAISPFTICNEEKIPTRLLKSCWWLLIVDKIPRVTYRPSCSSPNWRSFRWKYFHKYFRCWNIFCVWVHLSAGGSHWDRKINKWLSNLRTCRNLKRKKSVCFQEFELISRCLVWYSYWLSGEITN